MDMSDEVDKQLHGTIHYNKIQIEGNLARNDYDFRKEESLEEAKQDIREQIKRSPNTKTIIDLLDNAISINKKVLEADHQFLMHYLKHHLKTDTLTMDLLESNQTVKNLHDLVERHGDFGNYLTSLIKRYRIIQQGQTPAEAQAEQPKYYKYLQPYLLYWKLDKALAMAIEMGIISEYGEYLKWNRTMPCLAVFLDHIKQGNSNKWDLLKRQPLFFLNDDEIDSISKFKVYAKNLTKETEDFLKSIEPLLCFLQSL